MMPRHWLLHRHFWPLTRIQLVYFQQRVERLSKFLDLFELQERRKNSTSPSRKCWGQIGRHVVWPKKSIELKKPLCRNDKKKQKIEMTVCEVVNFLKREKKNCRTKTSDTFVKNCWSSLYFSWAIKY